MNLSPISILIYINTAHFLRVILRFSLTINFQIDWNRQKCHYFRTVLTNQTWFLSLFQACFLLWLFKVPSGEVEPPCMVHPSCDSSSYCRREVEPHCGVHLSCLKESWTTDLQDQWIFFGFQSYWFGNCNPC